MIGYFARHPNAANLLMLAAIVLGLTSLSGLERETFPEFTPSKVSVTVVYPGASAADVDELICLELDDALTSVTDLDDFECVSTDALATATLTMADSGDIGQFYNDVSSAVSSIGDLPSDAEQPAVAIAGRTEQIALIAISGVEGVEGLVRYADRMADAIAALPMVSDATVAGISDLELEVTFDQTALRRYGVSARDIADEVAARSLIAPIGDVDTEARSFTFRYADARRSVAELEELVVLQNEAGGFVRLGDLAVVRLTEEEPDRKSFVDGRRAAIIVVSKNKEDDAIDAFAQVEALLAVEQARYPAPFSIDIINNTTNVINERVQLVLSNTAQGLVLVFLVMCLFFSLRDALWISVALPVSFLGGVFAMSMVGVSVNMISLIALLMAVGLIMDDSIVIADNIAKWRARAGPREAASRGAAQVLPGIISSFLTTACVFGPLMFLSGEIGAILQVIPIVLLITIAISLVEAFLVLPNHLSHARVSAAANENRLAPRTLDRFKESRIVPAVRRLVAWRYLSLGVVFAALVLALGLITSGAVKIIGFPTTEGDTIEARIALNPGARLEQTEAVVEQLLVALEEVNAARTPGVDGDGPLVERVLVRYSTNADVKNAAANTVTITVDLSPSAERNVAADDVLEDWRRAAGPIPDLSQSSFTQTAIGPGGSDLDVELSARSLETLEAASEALYRRLLARDDVTEAYQDFTGGQPEIRIRLRPLGYALGLTPQALANQLRTAFSGLETDTFRDDASAFVVQVELGDTVATLSALDDFPVALAGDEPVALALVAEIVATDTFSQITRKNGLAIARIIGKIDRDATTSTEISRVATDELGPEIEAAYPGISIRIGGAAEDQQDTQSSILGALLTGLFGVYAILAFQFRSYTLPLVVMLAIPFALIGTILGHLALGLDLSMPSFIGFASLAGIVVNNAILFLTFFQAEVRQIGREGPGAAAGRAAREAAVAAAAVGAVRNRFRPVLLSSLTTFVGLLPILFETSPQAQVLAPLVVAVAFGLLASTVLVIFVLPSALAIYFDMVDVRKWSAQFEPDEGGAPGSGTAVSEAGTEARAG